MKSQLLNTAILAHKQLVDKYGGSHGIRDVGALESAINRPFMTFDSVDLYPSVIEKAAAIVESLLINHPFIDGNKRIGYFMMEFLLFKEQKMIILSEEKQYAFTIQVAEGKLNTDQISAWIRSNSVEF